MAWPSGKTPSAEEKRKTVQLKFFHLLQQTIICTMGCALQEYRQSWCKYKKVGKKIEQCIIIIIKMKMTVFWDVVLCNLIKI
jgi:hypothetical protein